MQSSIEEFARLLKKFSDERTPLFVFLMAGDKSFGAKISGFVREFTSEYVSFSDDATRSPNIRPSAFISISRASIVGCEYGESREVFPDSERDRIIWEEQWGASLLCFELASGGRLVVFERIEPGISA